MWQWIKSLLSDNPRQTQNVEHEGAGIQIGHTSVKTKGSQKITFEDGKMIVYADDPKIIAPPDANIEVRSLKDKS